MPNEQLITVKVRVPVGDRCFWCKQKTTLSIGGAEYCGLWGAYLDDAKKLQPCLDACKEEVCSLCGNMKSIPDFGGGVETDLPPCPKCTTKGDVPRETIPKV